ncbi:MBL fold metallo-hydrolase [Myxococcus sp. RHSTA-1-4]|uniref:MBL fold metallo-hydrolase n=1 Tax=Myxococcus sp. RHSTA-1-4 TaxID=2874601 RepID=UPI001CBE5580|nr:MBL fold metallo-hydrolase [Myxococcus sp. RHSTA-1-4]MBZ4419613.1 MBL fold metallo-hydrolase [Myxococcus sp. RHSTA-1-4]
MSPRLFAILGMLLAAVACEEPPPPAPPPPAPVRSAEPRRYFGVPPDGKLHVYFFNVGPGDAALIVSPEGHTVLVDSGPASAANHLVNRLPELLTQRLDLVVLTHPHADHFGALGPVLRRVGARQLLVPQTGATPPEYDELLTSIGGQGVEFISPSPPPSTPNAPLRLPLGTGVELNVLWPRPPKEVLDVPEAPLEANSIVLRLTYGDTALLLMGDAHAKTEAHLLARGMPLRATLLKVAAHGADGPTGDAFLQAVGPRAAVISAGAGNTRGTPAPATLKRLEAAGARVFRTDVAGEVQVVGDGKTLVVTPQRLPDGVPWDTRYTLAGLSAASVPAATAQATKPEPLEPEAPRGNTSKVQPAPARHGQVQVVDIDDLPAAEQAPRIRGTESRPSRGSTESRATPAGGYVGSSRTDVFHLPSCRNAAKIKPSNLVRFATREEAARNRRPARDCNP